MDNSPSSSMSQLNSVAKRERERERENFNGCRWEADPKPDLPLSLSCQKGEPHKNWPELSEAERNLRQASFCVAMKSKQQTNIATNDCNFGRWSPMKPILNTCRASNAIFVNGTNVALKLAPLTEVVTAVHAGKRSFSGVGSHVIHHVLAVNTLVDTKRAHIVRFAPEEKVRFRVIEIVHKGSNRPHERRSWNKTKRWNKRKTKPTERNLPKERQLIISPHIQKTQGEKGYS